MTGSLLILLPTRRRRANVERFLDAFNETSVLAELVILADDDDDSCDGLNLPASASLAVRPRAWLTPKLNRYAVPAAFEYQAVGWLADDCVPESVGWDAQLFEAIRHEPGIAYPRNGRRTDVAEHQVVSSAIIRALGWYYEPSMMHYWTDNVLTDLGRAAGCLRYVPEAVVTHLHHDSGGAIDATYTESVEANGSRDSDAYAHWRDHKMPADLARVKAAIG